MSRVNRREFIKAMTMMCGASAASLLISSCKSQIPQATCDSKPTLESPSPVKIPGLGHNTEPPGELRNTPEFANNLPDLVVARNGKPEDMVRRAIDAIGGISRFVSPGDYVIIKPNICVAYHSYEYAATTNPWVVGAIVKLAREAGARKIQVMDYPFGGTPEEAYQVSGIAEQVIASGGEMVTMSRLKFQEIELPQGSDLRKVEVFEDALKADVLIDVPIAKHHQLARLTLGMKNLMGLILNRQSIHGNMGERLADLTGLFQPDLTIIDAVRMLMAHGPTGGNLDDVKTMNTIVVSTDVVAADSYAATLFGLNPDDLSYVKAATRRELGRSKLNELSIEEISVE